MVDGLRDSVEEESSTQAAREEHAEPGSKNQVRIVEILVLGKLLVQREIWIGNCTVANNSFATHGKLVAQTFPSQECTHDTVY